MAEGLGVRERRAYTPPSELIRSRVLKAFEYPHPQDPDWFKGIFAPDAGEPQDCLMLALDVGEFPIRICITREELEEQIRPNSNDTLCILIFPSYPNERIRDKCLYFFEREWKIRTKAHFR